jgi:hypothetical protein
MRKEEIIKMKIARVKKEIRDTPYDKASEHHHGVLKAKLARLTADLEGPMNKGGGGGGGYAVKHSGDACVVLAGLPSVGKSTLLNALTNAESKVGNYDFTTLGVVPGMMEYKGVRIQILDLPGIIRGASKNKGFGKRVISVIRAADLVVLMTDWRRLAWFKKMEEELYDNNIRLGGILPKITVKKTNRGAIQVIDPHKNFDKQMVIDIAKELDFSNAMIQIDEKTDSVDRLIDGLAKNRKYMPVVKVVSKMDEKGSRAPKDKDCLLVSADMGMGLEELKEEIWRKLGLVRVYLKRSRTAVADKEKPLIVKRDSSLSTVVEKISTEMLGEIKEAHIWGMMARFAGQKVSLNAKVFDEMEVYFGR